MFVFDLFEKKEKRASDRPASRFVSGFSQNADAKNALNTAMQVAPDASTPEEALAALANQQMQVNQQQSTALDQQTAVNQQQTQQINNLVTNIQRKEKDFRDLNAQIANMPNVTAQQAAKMAQDIEAAHDKDSKEPVSVPDVVAKRSAAKTVAVPEPGASMSQLAAYQKVKDQGAKPVDTTVDTTTKTAIPEPTPAQAAAPEPTTSKALGQMATQLTPGRVIKGRGVPASAVTTNWAANQPTVQPKPTTGASNIKVFPSKINPQQAAGIQSLLASESVNEAQLKWSVPQNTSPKEIAKANLNNIVLGAIAPDRPPVKMYFTDGHGPTLPWNQVAALYNYLGALDKNNPGTQADVQNLLSNSRYFYDRMLNDIVGQTATDPVPQGQTVPDEQDPQAKLLEGDVVPFTNQQVVNQAYADALTFLQYAYKQNADENLVRTMRQDFASKYRQRFAILPDANNETYSMVDKQLSKRYRLPNPGFPLEEEPHDGKNAFSDGQGQWSSENNLISSGNNPHGFSEAETHDTTGARMYQAQEKFLVRHNGKDVAFFPDMEQAKAAAREMQQDLKGFATVHRIMRESKKKGVAEATGDQKFDTMMGRIVDPVAALSQDRVYEEQLEDYVFAFMNEFLGQMDRLGIEVWLDNPRSGEDLTNPKFLQAYEQASVKAVQKFMQGKKLDVNNQQLVAKVKADFDENADQVNPVAGFLGAFMQGFTVLRPGEIDVLNKAGMLKKPGEVDEAQTDYQKRRQRERDVDMGRPVAKQRPSKMTDYQKKRAQDKKEMELGESQMKDLFYKAQQDLKNLTDAQFIKTHGMSKVAFQQQYRTVLKPAAQQDVPVAESTNYWHKLQEERRRKAYSYLEELENALKDIK